MVIFDPTYLTNGSRWDQLFTGSPGQEELLSIYESLNENTSLESVTEDFEVKYPILILSQSSTYGPDGILNILAKSSLHETWWILVIKFDDASLASARFLHFDDATIDLTDAPPDKIFIAY